MIYGANASGKSSILKALDFLRAIVLAPADKKTEELKFYPFLFDKYTPHQNSILTIELIQNNVRYYYEIEFNKQAIVREELNFYKPNKANVYKRVTDLEKQFTKINFGSKFKIDKAFEKTLEANTLWNNTVLGGFLKTNIELIELKEVTDWFSNYLNASIDTNKSLEGFVTKQIDKFEIKKETVVNILKKADFNISDIIIKKEKKSPPYVWKALEAMDAPNSLIDSIKKNPLTETEFEHTINNIKYLLPFKQESQGTQRYYGFAGLLALLIEKPNAIFIDELESSLHPDLYTHFLLSFLINSKSSQILATTHNRELLNNRDIFRNDAIWFTEKNESSATELYSLDDFSTNIVRDSSNIYNAYKAGKLGGVPNLSDYYINMADAE